MTKREKIILGFMLGALLYGGYSLWRIPSSDDGGMITEKELASAKGLSLKLAEELRKESLTDIERYMLEQARAEWVGDPFLGQNLPMSAGTGKREPERPIANLAYTGYVEVSSKKKLAIINGMEYQVGEQLESGGYAVHSIEPDKIVLEDLNTQARIVVPFTGELF